MCFAAGRRERTRRARSGRRLPVEPRWPRTRPAAPPPSRGRRRCSSRRTPTRTVRRGDRRPCRPRAPAPARHPASRAAVRASRETSRLRAPRARARREGSRACRCRRRARGRVRLGSPRTGTRRPTPLRRPSDTTRRRHRRSRRHRSRAGTHPHPHSRGARGHDVARGATRADDADGADRRGRPRLEGSTPHDHHDRRVLHGASRHRRGLPAAGPARRLLARRHPQRPVDGRCRLPVGRWHLGRVAGDPAALALPPVHGRGVRARGRRAAARPGDRRGRGAAASVPPVVATARFVGARPPRGGGRLVLPHRRDRA